MSVSSELKRMRYHIGEYTKRQRYLSFATRDSLYKNIVTITKDLHALGELVGHPNEIKDHHVMKLLEYWKTKELSASTIKNRMANLRNIGRHYGNLSLQKSNSYYEIEQRNFTKTVENNNAIYKIDLSNIKAVHILRSIQLQAAFGLRREECLKIKPHQADKGDRLFLQGSWCKGNVARTVPILTEEQRKALDDAKALVGQHSSMIPKHRTYIQQRHLYDAQVKLTDASNLHGLRSAYAQRCFEEIAGYKCPLQGGKPRSEMTTAEKRIDEHYRTILSNQMGHGRWQVVASYCG